MALARKPSSKAGLTQIKDLLDPKRDIYKAVLTKSSAPPHKALARNLRHENA